MNSCRFGQHEGEQMMTKCSFLVWTIPLLMLGRCKAYCCPGCLFFSLCVVYLFVCHALFLQLLSYSWACVFLPSGSTHPAEGVALSRWQNASHWNHVDLSSVTDGTQKEIMNAFSGNVISKADVRSLQCSPFYLFFFEAIAHRCCLCYPAHVAHWLDFCELTHFTSTVKF